MICLTRDQTRFREQTMRPAAHSNRHFNMNQCFQSVSKGRNRRNGRGAAWFLSISSRAAAGLDHVAEGHMASILSPGTLRGACIK